MKCDKTFFLFLGFALVVLGTPAAHATNAAAEPLEAADAVATPSDSGTPVDSAAVTEVAPANAIEVPTAATPTATVSEAPTLPSPVSAAAAAEPVAPSPAPAAAKVTDAAEEEDDPEAMPSAVTAIVDDLRQSEKDVSLEDIARAQDALTRLDLLLDIEKKMNDIKKERQAGEEIGKKGSSRSFGGLPMGASPLPIPASNMGINPGMPGMQGGIGMPASLMGGMEMASGSGGFQVEQITGVNGRYRAVIEQGGIKKTVEQGDKVGRFTVQSISATGVTLSSGNDRKVLTVEDNGVPVVVRPR